MDAQEVFAAQLERSRFAGADAFARMEAVENLAESVTSRAVGKSAHWLKIEAKLDAYDFDKNGWRVLTLRPLYSDRSTEADGALRIELSAEGMDRQLFLPMPVQQARSFQNNAPSFPSFDGLLRVLAPRVDTEFSGDFAGSISIRYTPSEIVLFDAGAGQTVIDPTEVRLRHSFDATMAPKDLSKERNDEETPADKKTAPTGRFPILDVALGADYAQSLALIAEEMPDATRYQANTRLRQIALQEGGGEPIGDSEGYHNGTLIESVSKSDLVAIYHEPHAATDLVTAISRTKLFPPGQGPTWQALRASLLKSYPDIDGADLPEDGMPQRLIIWAKPKHVPGTPLDPSESACERSLKAAASVAQTRFGLDMKARANDHLRPMDNRATWFDQGGTQVIPQVASPFSLPDLFGRRKGCSKHEVMVLVFEYDSGGRIVEFRQAVSVPAFIEELQARTPAATAADETASDFDL